MEMDAGTYFIPLSSDGHAPNFYALVILREHRCTHNIFFSDAFNESAVKGKQMGIPGTKSKAASQCGYFDATYCRILQV